MLDFLKMSVMAVTDISKFQPFFPNARYNRNGHLEILAIFSMSVTADTGISKFCFFLNVRCGRNGRLKILTIFPNVRYGRNGHSKNLTIFSTGPAQPVLFSQVLSPVNLAVFTPAAGALPPRCAGAVRAGGAAARPVYHTDRPRGRAAGRGQA